LRVLLALAPANLPRAAEIAIDPIVLLFTLGLSLLSGLFFGAIPVVPYCRPQLAEALHVTGRWSTGSVEKLRTRGVLVVVQIALALVLLISAGLMIRTFRELSNVNPGFAGPAEVQTLKVQIPQTALPGVELTARRQQEILNKFAALPGVVSAAYMSDVPLSGGVAADLLVPEGKVFRDGETPRSTQSRFISPGLFDTLRIPLVRGRDLTWTDFYERRAVVLISESVARAEWGSAEKAVGQRMRGGSAADRWKEIIGVVGDVHDRGLHQPVTDTVYYPVLGAGVYNNREYVWRPITYVLRTSRAGTPALLDELRHAVWAVDPDLPLLNVQTMAEILDGSLARTSFTLVMLAIAGVMALLLGVIGIYGAISYGVSERTREIGIRIALGAEGRQVRRMFVQQGLLMAAVGVCAGLGAAALLTRWMTSLLFEVSALDPLTYVVVSVVLIAAASAAAYIPSRRATHVDPMNSLRME
jgi:predicted permease